MKTLLFIVIGLVLVIWFGWRFLSRRHTLPCPSWLSWMVERDNPFTKVNRAATIIKHLKLEPGMTVLDVGCGPGRLSVPVAKHVGTTGKVVAMDIQKGMLNRAREKAKAANLTNIQFLQAGIGENKLPHNTFDRILLVTVLGEIPNQHAALEEIYSALKPRGILSVTEIIFDPHFHRSSTAIRLASNVGFQKKALYGNRIAYTLHLGKSLGV